MAAVKQASVPSRSPLPIVLPQTTCTPAEIMPPSAANTRSSGVANPYALMESTPRNRPIMMLSISMHNVTVIIDTTCVASISRNSFLIIVFHPR